MTREIGQNSRICVLWGCASWGCVLLVASRIPTGCSPCGAGGDRLSLLGTGWNVLEMPPAALDAPSGAWQGNTLLRTQWLGDQLGRCCGQIALFCLNWEKYNTGNAKGKQSGQALVSSWLSVDLPLVTLGKMSCGLGMQAVWCWPERCTVLLWTHPDHLAWCMQPHCRCGVQPGSPTPGEVGHCSAGFPIQCYLIISIAPRSLENGFIHMS